MDKGKTALSVVSFVLVAACGFWLVSWFVRVFSNANPSVQASLIAAGVAFATVLFAFWKERSRAIKEAHREKKIEIYSSLFNLVFSVLANEKKNPELNEHMLSSAEFQEKMVEFKKNLMFYGSPKVINAFSRWQLNSSGSGLHPTKALRDMGEIFLAMRADIGLSNFGLDSLSIHQLNITDNLQEIAKAESKP